MGHDGNKAVYQVDLRRYDDSHPDSAYFRSTDLLKQVRFTDFSDTEESGEFVVRTAEFSLDLINNRGGDGVATKIALGHGAMNLMVTGLTLYSDVSDHPFSPPALGPTRIFET